MDVFCGQSSISSISSFLLFGTNIECLAHRGLDHVNSHSSHDDTNCVSMQKTEPIRSENGLHNIALRNAVKLLRHGQHLLSSNGSISRSEQSLIYRGLVTHLRDVGNLLATSAEPTISISLLDATSLLFLSIHLLAVCATSRCDLAEEDVLESLTHLYGGFLTSYSGVQKLVQAFEDSRLERAWLDCLFSDFLQEINFVAELRQRPGVLSWAQEIKQASSEIDIFPSVVLSRIDIGIATVSLLDSWRTSQAILQLQLTNIEQIRRHSDTITKACLDLAKLCAYDCGREVRITMISCEKLTGRHYVPQ